MREIQEVKRYVASVVSAIEEYETTIVEKLEAAMEFDGGAVKPRLLSSRFVLRKESRSFYSRDRVKRRQPFLSVVHAADINQLARISVIRSRRITKIIRHDCFWLNARPKLLY
jgi:hypothetical protein